MRDYLEYEFIENPVDFYVLNMGQADRPQDPFNPDNRILIPFVALFEEIKRQDEMIYLDNNNSSPIPHYSRTIGLSDSNLTKIIKLIHNQNIYL